MALLRDYWLRKRLVREQMQIKSLNRAADFHVRWNNGRSIRRGVQYIIAANDHCLSVMLNYGAFLTDGLCMNVRCI